MPTLLRREPLRALTLTLLPAVIVSFASVLPAADEATTWEKHVRPILKSKCFHCHGEEDHREGGLDLRLVRLLKKGGDSGTAIVAGKPAESLLWQRVHDGEMPPKDNPLTPQEIQAIERWIASGAATSRPEPDDPNAAVITEEERGFWSFQPVARAPIPNVKRSADVRTPVDAFLLSRLESHDLGFSPEADRRTLIRRASFDLLGLPPSPNDVEEFVADASPDAYERMIDRLLASPHYGERWARHWLDIAGYADSEGYSDDDRVRADSWKYRDYVIRSLNDDKPFDRFVIEQLAGDELVTPPFKNLTADQIELLTATGFLRQAPDGTGSGGVDQTVARNQVMADTIQIVSSSLLGLSVACAQCHNHRYDPIPQTDYYRFRAVFEPALNVATWRAPLARRVSLFTDEDRAKSAEIEAEALKVVATREAKLAEFIERTFESELAKLPEEKREPIRTARSTPEKERTADQKQLLKEHPSVNVSAGSLYLYDRKAADELKQLADDAQKIRDTKPVEPFIRTLSEIPGQVPDTRLFTRGDPQQPQQAMSPSELTVLNGSASDIKANDPSLPTTGRRLAYAGRLVDGSHPLTARVLVNRIWMHHFGRGIVATPSDFGSLGERPTHPELLDWLASEFQRSATSAKSPGLGWSLKALHRLLMTSTAYRQSSLRNSALDTIDPDNRLLGRMSVRRLEAELVRDANLFVDGTLTVKLYGPPVPVMQDEVGQIVVGMENLNGENRPGTVIPLHGEEYRRSLYVQVRRSRPLGVLETFDAPTMTPNCEIRSASTVATQSLLMMNSTFLIESATHFAHRVRSEASDSAAAQVETAWRIAFGETPSLEVLERSTSFLEQQAGLFREKAKPADAKNPAPDPADQALTVYCQALLSSNQFLYVD